MISRVSVYEDGAGRGFDTRGEPDGFPDYPVPVPETQPTVAPGEATYSTRKAALERELLGAGAGLPVTVLRARRGARAVQPAAAGAVLRAAEPGRSAGPGAGVPGESRFHRASARNIAELVRPAAARPGSGVLNACDGQAPTVAGIGAAIDAVMGVETRTVYVDGPPAGPVGRTPWSVPRPVVCDMSAAERELGYRPVVSYAESLPETVERLTGALRGRDWREVFPLLAQACPDLFDYAAEGAWRTA